ncbi:MAG: hypothetical protein U0836_10925 [Pirellulales bacterium]
MVRFVVPVAVLLALAGGYVVGQQPGRPKQNSGSERELAARREHVRELEQLYKKTQALFDKGSKGGEQEKIYVAQTKLELARAELAMAEGKRAEIAGHLEKAASAADRAVPAVRSAYDVGVACFGELLDALQDQADVKATLARMGAAVDRRDAGAVAPERELDARREHVRELDRLCDTFDTIIRFSDKGLGKEKLCVTQTRLELARVELAKAAAKPDEVAAHYANAAQAADRAVTAVRVAFEVGQRNVEKDHYELGESSLADMLDALQTQADVKAALARLQK